MSYNITNITAANVTSMRGLFTLGNNLSFGILGPGLSFLFYGIFFFTALGAIGDPKKAIITSSFLTGIINLFLIHPKLQMISGFVAAIPWVILAITMLLGD